MVDFREPLYRIEYQKLHILIYIWGDERVFFAQIHDEQRHPVGAAPKLYTSIDAAINVCKDLIDFIYGSVDCYQDRPEPTPPYQYTMPARQTAHLTWVG